MGGPGKAGTPGAVGEELLYGNGELQGKVIATTDTGGRIIEFSYQGSFREHLQRLGEVPLPPYIHKNLPIQSATKPSMHPGRAQ